jgi:phosphoglycolate phosphatase
VRGDFCLLPSPFPLLPFATLPVNVLIFDFDGTIADSFEAVLTISNRLAEEFGYPPTSPEEIEQVRDLSSREILNRSGVPFYRLPFLLRRLRVELNHEVAHLQPVTGMREALQQLKQQGHQLGIVTSNSEENVKAFLDAQDMPLLFDFIGSGLTLFGKGRVIRRIMKKYRIDPAIAFYVGDETRDIEAAKKIRLKSIAVSWGFNSSRVLAEHAPNYLIHHPAELLEVMGGRSD